MKVLLFDPPHFCTRGQVVQVHPLGLGALTAVLRPDHDVLQVIPDVRPHEDVWATMRAVLQEHRPDVVGISALTASYPAARRLAALVPEVLGNEVAVVLGGPHPSFAAESVLKDPGVTHVVVGEGEETFVALLRSLEQGASGESIPGVALRVGERIHRATPRPPMSNLDAYPAPARDQVLWEEELMPSFYQSIITVRGCPYRCSYCSVPASSQRRTRYRSATTVADEVDHLRDRYGIDFLFFHDSVFTLNRKRTLALMLELTRRGTRVPFTCQTRTDRVDGELLDAMADAGCHQIYFGIESGHPETLKRIHKDVSISGVHDAVRATKARGIRAAGFFMVGFPWENETHIDATLELATGIGLDSASLFSATPLPGTELWTQTDTTLLPERIDFRTPQVNLTGMPHERYAARYEHARQTIEQYNAAQTAARLTNDVQSHWPRG